MKRWYCLSYLSTTRRRRSNRRGASALSIYLSCHPSVSSVCSALLYDHRLCPFFAFKEMFANSLFVCHSDLDNCQIIISFVLYCEYYYCLSLPTNKKSSQDTSTHRSTRNWRDARFLLAQEDTISWWPVQTNGWLIVNCLFGGKHSIGMRQKTTGQTLPLLPSAEPTWTSTERDCSRDAFCLCSGGWRLFD